MKQVNRFSLEEILCPQENKTEPEIKNTEPVSAEVRDLLSKITLTIGVVSFENEAIVNYDTSEIKILKTLC